MHSVSGTSGAAPIWAEVMGFLHRNTPSRPPKAPAGVLNQQVKFGLASNGSMPIESARSEWFVNGTQQSLFAMDSIAASADHSKARGRKDSKSAANPEQSKESASILRPASGTILALDPDIPPESQRVQLVARQAGMASEQAWHDNSLRWQLVTRQYAAPPAGSPPNTKPVMREVRRELGRGSQVGWLPWPGRHQLELQDASGKLLDSVYIEVRGAGALVAGPEDIKKKR